MKEAIAVVLKMHGFDKEFINRILNSKNYKLLEEAIIAECMRRIDYHNKLLLLIRNDGLI